MANSETSSSEDEQDSSSVDILGVSSDEEGDAASRLAALCGVQREAPRVPQGSSSGSSSGSSGSGSSGSGSSSSSSSGSGSSGSSGDSASSGTDSSGNSSSERSREESSSSGTAESEVSSQQHNSPEIPLASPLGSHPLPQPGTLDQQKSKEIASSSASKRTLDVSPGEDDADFQGKRSKRNEDEEDDITILKGVLDYKSKNGVYPFANSVAMQDFIKNWLHRDGDYSAAFNDKIQELKERYINNIVNEDEAKSDLLGPRGRNIFALSKEIWGTQTDDTNESKGSRPIKFFAQTYQRKKTAGTIGSKDSRPIEVFAQTYQRKKTASTNRSRDTRSMKFFGRTYQRRKK